MHPEQHADLSSPATSNGPDQIGSHIDSSPVDFNSLSLPFLEEQLARYQQSPADVEPEWRSYFEAMANGNSQSVRLGPSFRPASLFNPPLPDGPAKRPRPEADLAVLQER